MSTIRRVGVVVSVLAIGLVAGVFAINHVRVSKPVAESLAEDYRNDGIELRAHYAYYVLPGTLVLDLQAADRASPADLGRVLFQSAEAFHDRGVSFKQIVLSRSGTAVFLMHGEDFAEIGEQAGYGENPIYMIRKLPSKLHEADGTPAYGEWTGGLLGVVPKEMEDFNDAMSKWAIGPSAR